jgi:hypothetical protein
MEDAAVDVDVVVDRRLRRTLLRVRSMTQTRKLRMRYNNHRHRPIWHK